MYSENLSSNCKAVQKLWGKSDKVGILVLSHKGSPSSWRSSSRGGYTLIISSNIIDCFTSNDQVFTDNTFIAFNELFHVR